MWKSILAAISIISTPNVASGTPWNVDVFGGAGLGGILRWDGIGREVDTGDVYGIALTRTAENVEFGIELARTVSTYTLEFPSSISGTSAMAIAKVNLGTHGRFETYLGLGLGLVQVEYVNASPSYANADMEFAAQALFGVRYPITSGTSAFVEARFLRAKDAHIAHAPARADADFRSKSIVLGLRKQFRTPRLKGVR